MSKCTCDKCHRSMEINVKKKRLPDQPGKGLRDIDQHYIKCPHCKSTYTVNYTDKAIRKLQARQRVLQNDKTLEVDDYTRLPEFADNKALLERMTGKLRERVEA